MRWPLPAGSLKRRYRARLERTPSRIFSDFGAFKQHLLEPLRLPRRRMSLTVSEADESSVTNARLLSRQSL